jgi:hypothetical protein
MVTVRFAPETVRGNTPGVFREKTFLKRILKEVHGDLNKIHHAFFN